MRILRRCFESVRVRFMRRRKLIRYAIDKMHALDRTENDLGERFDKAVNDVGEMRDTLLTEQSSRKYLESEVTRLERQNDALASKVEILERERDLMAMVIRRDQERVASETAMYYKLTQGDGNQKLRHAGAEVAERLTPNFGQ